MKDLRRLLTLFGEYRRDLFLAMGFVLIETFFELVIPVLMADLIDVGVAGGDVHYILVKGAQMGLCAVLALIAGLLYARFAARAAYGWGATCAWRSSSACRPTPSVTWTALRPRVSSPA